MKARSLPTLVIGGVSSGVGKTTVTLGLLEALTRRGLTVQAFKVGPDFIDPGFHTLATGRRSQTLDGWMCGREHALDTVARCAADADVAVVEGVMGCFDGVGASGENGSTAEMAKWLGAPMILVVDAGAMVRSAAAVVLGFERLDPALDLAGVVLNQVGGARHRRWLREAVEGTCRARVLGAVPRQAGVALPERHLGLVTAAEGGYDEKLRSELAALTEAHVDVDAVLTLARERARPAPAQVEGPAPHGAQVRIGVARDRAFQFYYPENLDRLRAAGADLVFFSPLADAELPDVDGLYIGGGYPELHGRELSANRGLREAVRAFSTSGRPVYAECGGLMYLARTIEDAAGAEWPMVGVLPARVRMGAGRLVIGYREARTARPGPLGPAGLIARGHEFHCSTLDPLDAGIDRAYEVRDANGGPPEAEGFLIGNTLMSYVHLHFGSCPALARGFVEACRAASRGGIA
jgi:cobyrinic acid a,c-diamide synthase